jgi:hypothetical protein
LINPFPEDEDEDIISNACENIRAYVWVSQALARKAAFEQALRGLAALERAIFFYWREICFA